MTAKTLGTEGASRLRGEGSRQGWLYRIFLIAVTLRMFISLDVLNAIMHYSTPGGIILEKIHPASWLLAGLTAVLIPAVSRKPTRSQREIFTAMLTLTGAIIAAVVLALFAGSGDLGLGYLVDTILIACAITFCTLALTPTNRGRATDALLTMLVLNSAVSIAEITFKIHFLPISGAEETFRAQAALSHPLDLGLCNAVAIAFVYLAKWSPSRKFISIAMLLTGILAAGARTASALGFTLAIAGLLMPYSPKTRTPEDRARKLAIFIAVLALLPAGILLIGGSGLGARFETLSLEEDSVSARIVILQVFTLFGWHNLVFGPGLNTLTQLSQNVLHLEQIENWLVVYIFQFGIIGTALIVAGYLFAFTRFWKHSVAHGKLAILVFIIVALSNNALSTKTPVLMLLFLFLAAHLKDTAHQDH